MLRLCLIPNQPHHVIFYRFKPLRFRVVCSGLMWFAISVNLASIWMADYSIIFIATLLAFFMTLPVIVFCCLSVLWSLKQPGPVETERTEGNNMKRRAFNIISLNLGIILVTYFPILVVLSLNTILSWDIFFLGYLFYPAMYLKVLGGIAQPLLYLYKAGKLPRKCFFRAVKPSWKNSNRYRNSLNEMFSPHQIIFLVRLTYFLIILTYFPVISIYVLPIIKYFPCYIEIFARDIEIYSYWDLFLLNEWCVQMPRTPASRVALVTSFPVP